MFTLLTTLTDGEQVHEPIAPRATLLDVRSFEEFAYQRIRGAIHIPLKELSARTSELGAKDNPVLVYCRSGARSRKAAMLLRIAGFTHVQDLGGLLGWAKH